MKELKNSPENTDSFTTRDLRILSYSGAIIMVVVALSVSLFAVKYWLKRFTWKDSPWKVFFGFLFGFIGLMVVSWRCDKEMKRKSNDDSSIMALLYFIANTFFLTIFSTIALKEIDEYMHLDVRSLQIALILTGIIFGSFLFYAITFHKYNGKESKNYYIALIVIMLIEILVIIPMVLFYSKTASLVFSFFCSISSGLLLLLLILAVESSLKSNVINHMRKHQQRYLIVKVSTAIAMRVLELFLEILKLVIANNKN